MSRDDAYFERKLKSFATFLNRWRGADAIMRELTVSHKSLTIVLTRGSDPKNLVISCGDPVTIRGPIYWQISDITIARTTLPDGTEGFVLEDQRADFRVPCISVEIFENMKL